MAAGRKLQAEIEKVLKKVDEGIEEFQNIWDSVHNAQHASQREKFEAELKTQIKKLQRDREQIKAWQGDKTVKDKNGLAESRKKIELEMERFKEFERDAKTKPHSKEGLMKSDKVDPHEEVKNNNRAWIKKFIGKLRVQVDELEADVEAAKKGKKGEEGKVKHLLFVQERHRWHITKLEQLLRKINNDDCTGTELEELGSVTELVQYYVEDNSQTEGEFQTFDTIYEGFGLEEVEDYFAVGKEPNSRRDSDATLEPVEKDDDFDSAPIERATTPTSKPPSKRIGGQVAEAIKVFSKDTSAKTPKASEDADSGGAGSSGSKPVSKLWPPMVSVWTNPPASGSTSQVPVGPPPPPKASLPVGPNVSRLAPTLPPPTQPAPAPDRPPPPGQAPILNAPPQQPPPKSAPYQPPPPHQPPAQAPPTQAPPQPPVPSPPMGSPPSRPQACPVSAIGTLSSAHLASLSGAPMPPPPSVAPPAPREGSVHSAAHSLPPPSTLSAGGQGSGAPQQQAPSMVPPPPPPLLPPPPPSAAPAAPPLAAREAVAVESTLGALASKFRPPSEAPPPPVEMPPPPPESGAFSDGAELESLAMRLIYPDSPMKWGVTTVAIRSVPPVVEGQDLAREWLDSLGFRGTYDFLLCVTLRKQQLAHIGTIVVNFISSDAADLVVKTLYHHKDIDVVAAAVQGSEALEKVLGAYAEYARVPQIAPSASASDSSGFRSSAPPKSVPTMEPMDQGHLDALHLLGASHRHLPLPTDGQKNRKYVPRSPYLHLDSRGNIAYPTQPSPSFEDPTMFEKYDLDTLFFIFYYQQGSYQQYLAAKELKKLSWRYHTKYLTWFQRHEEPKTAAKDYERGAYVYFDHDSGWCQRIKSEFTFEYQYLEDEVV